MAVELNVRTQLTKIIEELQAITKEAGKVGEHLQTGADAVSEHLESNVKKTASFLETLRGLGGRVAQQLRQDFKSLLALNAVTESLKLSAQFRGTITEAITLSDTIRKVGGTLGLVGDQFSRFQANMLRGLGQIGMSAEAAGNALTGIAETPVRGENNIIGYAKTASQLASVSREQGREGDIAKGLSSAVVARGGNPNDLKQMQAVATDVLRIRQSTGKGATESLGALTGLFSSSNQDFRSQIQKGGGVSLATASLMGGKDATSFLERYLSMNRIERMGAEAQGLGRLIGPEGQLNGTAFQSTLREAKGRGMGDAQAGLKTFGFSDEEAKGFIRLAEAIKTNGDVIEKARTRVVDLNRAYQESRGFSEAFKASLNRVKGFLASPISAITQHGTNLLNGASQSNLGSTAVVAGGGVLAALLAGGGLRGVGKGLGLGGAAGLAKGAAIEGITGRQVQPVYVVNASEIGGGSVAGALGAGGIAGAVGKAGAVGLAIGGGAAAGYGLAQLVKTHTRGTNSEGYEGDAVDRLLYKLDALMSGRLTGLSSIVRERNSQTKVIVELNKRDLRESKQPGRGASFGP